MAKTWQNRTVAAFVCCCMLLATSRCIGDADGFNTFKNAFTSPVSKIGQYQRAKHSKAVDAHTPRVFLGTSRMPLNVLTTQLTTKELESNIESVKNSRFIGKTHFSFEEYVNKFKSVNKVHLLVGVRQNNVFCLIITIFNPVWTWTPCTVVKSEDKDKQTSYYAATVMYYRRGLTLSAETMGTVDGLVWYNVEIRDYADISQGRRKNHSFSEFSNELERKTETPIRNYYAFLMHKKGRIINREWFATQPIKGSQAFATNALLFMPLADVFRNYMKIAESTHKELINDDVLAQAMTFDKTISVYVGMLYSDLPFCFIKTYSHIYLCSLALGNAPSPENAILVNHDSEYIAWLKRQNVLYTTNSEKDDTELFYYVYEVVINNTRNFASKKYFNYRFYMLPPVVTVGTSPNIRSIPSKRRQPRKERSGTSALPDKQTLPTDPADTTLSPKRSNARRHSANASLGRSVGGSGERRASRLSGRTDNQLPRLVDALTLAMNTSDLLAINTADPFADYLKKKCPAVEGGPYLKNVNSPKILPTGEELRSLLQSGNIHTVKEKLHDIELPDFFLRYPMTDSKVHVFVGINNNTPFCVVQSDRRYFQCGVEVTDIEDATMATDIEDATKALLIRDGGFIVELSILTQHVITKVPGGEFLCNVYRGKNNESGMPGNSVPVVFFGP